MSDDLPPHLKQGELFEKGGEYPVVARYSTEPGDPGQDVGYFCIEINHLETKRMIGSETKSSWFRNETLQRQR